MSAFLQEEFTRQQKIGISYHFFFSYKACPAIFIAELLLRSEEFLGDYSLPHDLIMYVWRQAKIQSVKEEYTERSAWTLGTELL